MKKTIQKLFAYLFAFIAVFSYNLNASVTGANYTDVDNLLGIDDTNYEDPNTTLMGVVQMLKQPVVDAKKVMSAVETAKKNIDAKQQRENLYNSVTARQRFLVGKKAELTPQAKQLIDNRGQGEFKEGVIYFLHEFAAAMTGNNPIIRSGDDVSTGFSNLLPNGIVPAEKSMAIDFIAVDHIANAVAGTFLFNAPNDLATAAIMALGADFEIRVDNMVVATIPGYLFKEERIVKGIQTRSGGVGNGYNLEKPILVKGNSVIQASINYPDGITEALPGAGGSNVFRITMLGTELSNRS